MSRLFYSYPASTELTLAACTLDHVYLVCEPPGDPYYLCRIMEFLHVRSDDPASPVDSIRVNWYYRPRDVQRFNNDTRLVYGTMHSDMCPITSLRGKCAIKHRSEIGDLEAYRKEKDSFYFLQIFDRFIHRWYECIPVAQIINVPERVKKALDERWKFVVVEIARVKELTSAVKTCKRCTRYCRTSESVDCAICQNSYHMNCVQPPLPKKPSRGFAWACAPCSRASEKRLEARNTPLASGNVTEVEEEEPIEEEQPQMPPSHDTTCAPSPTQDPMLIDEPPATQTEVAMAKMWPMRYLGIHCRVEDALQYDDRAIYPRASSRLGPRHQAIIAPWFGQPVQLVKPTEIKKRYNKGNASKKEAKLTKETIAALEADREERAQRPKWVQDEPPGYVPRGEDYPNDDPRNTAQLLFKMPEGTEPGFYPGNSHRENLEGERAREVDLYIRRAKQQARQIGVPPFGGNFLDKALEVLTAKNYHQDAALLALAEVDRVKDLHEPVLSKADLIKFEEGVGKYGSEHRMIRQHMKTTQSLANIIRFYYLWKKTPKGREVWGNFGGRKGSKRRLDSDAGAQLQQSVAHTKDDSAFDGDKAVQKNRGFACKFCNTTHSRQWRKAPGVAPGQTMSDCKNGKDARNKPMLLALCLRCAHLWRKYAIQWEDADEVARKLAQSGGRALKRRIDEELLRELVAANEVAERGRSDSQPAAAAETGEPPKKKSKTDAGASTDAPKKKAPPPPPPPKEPTPPPPPIVPSAPQWRVLPCQVCKTLGDTVACECCKLTVHPKCFGLSQNEGMKAHGERRWVCEQCTNDRNPTVSTEHSCCLCMTEETSIDLVEPPRVSHKKKTDREREKERLEKELADNLRAEYRNKQLLQHRPLGPREPLKRTAGNNWVHVYCAVWTPEIRFSNAKKLELAEGFQQIPQARHQAVCKLCKNRDHANRLRVDKGACVSCFQCNANFHVSCAFEAGYTFGFDVTPVKGSRKDQIPTATLRDETGSVTAAIWCKDHIIKSVVHPIHEVVPETGKLALQTFVETFKQADLTLTGTVRKANIAQLAKDKGQQILQPTSGLNGRRESTSNNSIAAAVRRGARTSLAAEVKRDLEDSEAMANNAQTYQNDSRCAKCNIDVTPRWHAIGGDPAAKEPTPPKSPPGRFKQNIRFMPPGARGRAWDGMHDRQPRPAVNSSRGAPSVSAESQADSHAADGAVLGESSQRPPPVPHTPPEEVDPEQDETKQGYLCHKCFVKKKLGLSPAPPAPPADASPKRKYLMNMGYGAPGPSTYDHSQPPRMPQDDLPPPAPAAPPSGDAVGVQYEYEYGSFHPSGAPAGPSYHQYTPSHQPNQWLWWR